MTNGVIITNGTVGANKLGAVDGISGLVLTTNVAPAGLALGVSKSITKLKDAEALGITADYDSTNAVRVHRPIKEFYRKAGDGAKLWILLAGQAVTMQELVEDVDSLYCKKLIIDAGGEIKLLAVGICPAAAYVPVLLDGMDEDVRLSLPLAQGLAEWARDSFRPINVFLEGREYNGLAAAALHLREIPNLQADKVSLIIGQDWDYAETQDAVGKKMADIGTFLGSEASIPVHSNPGEVETMNLADARRNVWLTPGLSSHVKVKDVEEDVATLDGKGYIFGMTYTDYAGVYWNSDHTCTEIIQDEDNNVNTYCIAYGRIQDKARRQLRIALLPKVKTTHKIDPATGKLPIGTIKYFEGIGDRVFGRMEDDDEVSGGKTYVDPDSDLSVIPRTLKASFTVVPPNTIDQINGTINLKSQL